jgi:menaquinone-dependent protoporphyrinogen IX oxidase
MKAIVVYESVYGNTRAVAEAIAEGLGGSEVVAVSKADPIPVADLLVIGGPTHMHGMASSRTRQVAVSAAHEDGTHVEPEAAEGPGLRAWLRDLPDAKGARAAAFDTRLDKSPWLTGVASRGIARRLHRRGYEIVGTESFLVEDGEGPLEEGELDRARAWGAELAGSLAQTIGTAP